MEFKKEKLVRFNGGQNLEKTETQVTRFLDLEGLRIFLFSCLKALFVHPLFFYLPSVTNKEKSSCMDTDLNLGITVTCFRTLADVFYVVHIVIKLRTAYVSPSSRVFGRGELVMDPKLIARRYLRSDFFIDLVAALPLPQIVIWFIIPTIRSSRADHTNNALVLIVLLQYIPRLYLIFPLSSEIIEATGVVTKTAWAGAAYNLLLYMLASHVLGASSYLLSIELHATCWKSACKHELSPITCNPRYLNCDAFEFPDRKSWENTTNLSSYGQSLSTSTFIGETAFAILIAILGLVLFAHLIGIVQTYLQSITVRLEEWRLKRGNTEEWMRHRQLPQSLRERVRRFVQYKWLATRGVDEESILRALPTNLRRDIQRHLCLDLVRPVPFFSQMDDQLLDAICEHLVSCLSTQGNYIVREGDPVTEMLFIIRGKLGSSTPNGGQTGFFNSITSRPGDFCGEELLAWALLPKSTLNLPSSTRTVRALEEVEAAWRQHKKRVMAKSLSMSESFSVSVDEQTVCDETTLEEDEPSFAPSNSQAKQHLGVLQNSTFKFSSKSASRFAANTRRGAQKVKNVEMLKLQKPEEPDFSTEPDDD
uniref:Cyclic nucleotide-binding domain-containing protein n=1 Tax=Populus alba TaxID=43335 RepID=A0A4U5MZ83_POPAL|nr:hypothetical protein D5086_0000286450 [Populus alba]